MQAASARGRREELAEARKSEAEARDRVVVLERQLGEQEEKIADLTQRLEQSQHCMDMLFDVDPSET